MAPQAPKFLPPACPGVAPEVALFLLTGACFPVATTFFQNATQTKSDQIDRAELKKQLGILRGGLFDAQPHLEMIVSSLAADKIEANSIHPVGQNPLGLVRAQQQIYRSMLEGIIAVIAKIDDAAIVLSVFPYPYKDSAPWWKDLRTLQFQINGILQSTEFSIWTDKLREAVKTSITLVNSMSDAFNSPLRDIESQRIPDYGDLMIASRKLEKEPQSSTLWAVSPHLSIILMTAILSSIAGTIFQLVYPPSRVQLQNERSGIQRIGMAVTEAQGLQKEFRRLLGPGDTLASDALPAGMNPMWLDRGQLGLYRQAREQASNTLLIITRAYLSLPFLHLDPPKVNVLAPMLKRLQVLVYTIQKATTYGDMHVFLKEGFSLTEKMINSL